MSTPQQTRHLITYLTPHVGSAVSVQLVGGAVITGVLPSPTPKTPQASTPRPPCCTWRPPAAPPGRLTRQTSSPPPPSHPPRPCGSPGASAPDPPPRR